MRPTVLPKGDHPQTFSGSGARAAVRKADPAAPLRPDALAKRVCSFVNACRASGELPAFINTTPRGFNYLVRWLVAEHVPVRRAPSATRLARAVATACFGDRHLWQDLGLSGRSDVSRLFAARFPAVFAANADDIKWKKFLFAELARRYGGDPYPPNCTRCDDFATCFPERQAKSKRSGKIVAPR